MSQNIPRKSMGSAADWCKAVVEEVAPQITTIPPPPLPPILKLTSKTTTTNTATSPTPSLSGAVSAATMAQFERYNAQSQSSSTGLVSMNSMYMPPAPYQATAPLSATYAYPQYVASAIPATSWASVVSGDAPTQATTTISRKPNVSRFQPVTNVTSSTNPTGALPATIKTASSSSSGKQAWPPSLKAYFDRCFKECTTDVDRMHVTDTLQAKIAKVTADGRLSIHRWDLEPMVTIPSQAEKKKVIVSMPVWTAQPLPAPVSSSTATTKYSLQSLIMDEAGKKRKSRWEASSPIPDTASVASSFPSSPTKLWKEKAPVKKQKGGILEMAETLLLSEDEIAARKKRANRFVSEAESMALPVFAPLATGKDKKKDKNKKKGKSTDNYYGPTATDNSEFNLESLRIEGTCQRVEKDYLRLTSAPHPSTVRPEKVLRAALTNLINKWRNGSIEYISLCSQMKAVRQDLTVQHIQNDFTVEVYETHARMALQNGDLNEYNQCQTQLKNLYVRSLRGCEAEFTAYRILYYVYLLGNKKYTSGGSDLAFIMASLIGRNDLQSDAAVKHALQVREAIWTDNFHRFFLLYQQTPNMGNRILDLMVDTIRMQFVQRLCKAIKPQVSASFVLLETAFALTPEPIKSPSPARSSSSKSHKKSSHAAPVVVSEGLEFLKKIGCLLVKATDASTDGSLAVNSNFIEEEWDINTKDSVIDFSAVLTQDKLLL